MKNLCDYIFESVEMGDCGVSFEMFRDYLLNQDVNDPDYDDVKFQAFRQHMFDRFGKRAPQILNTFDEWVDSMMEELLRYVPVIDDTMMRFIYDRITKTPLSKLDKLIGTGANACTFDLGDKVIKCFYRKEIGSYDRKFYEVCMTGQYKVFPKVYRVGKGYVVLEKLTPSTKRCKDLIHRLHADKGDETLYQYILQGRTHDRSWGRKDQEVIDWMKEVRAALDACGIDSKDYGDLHSGNLGEREDGQIVFFDI